MNKNNAQILFTFTLLLAAFALAACDASAQRAMLAADCALGWMWKYLVIRPGRCRNKSRCPEGQPKQDEIL